MADSTLDPDETGRRRDRSLGRGHGVDALGPSDTSDSGSDVVGADGLAHDAAIPLDTGTNADPEYGSAGHTAGPDFGDANLSSDSDSTGTGETAAAGRDTVVEAGSDIGVDQIQDLPDLPLDEELDDLSDAERNQGWRDQRRNPSPGASKR